MRTLRQIGLAVTCITVMRATAARAQGTAVPPVTSGYDNGFFIQSPDGSHRLAFGLVAQVDGRFALDDSLALTNTFTTRKVRPTLSGRVAKCFDFKVTPDFGNGTPGLLSPQRTQSCLIRNRSR